MEREMNASELEDTINTIHSTMRCPVCNNVPMFENSVQQCNKGHVICGDCKRTCQHCPVCHDKMLIKKPLLFCRLMAIVPKPTQMGMLSQDTLKNIVDSFFELMKCPLCHKIPSSNSISQCNKGHVVCDPCKQTLPLNPVPFENYHKCPVCKAHFIYKQPFFFSELLKVVPKPCQFTGCLTFYKEGDNHESICFFKPTVCYLCTAKCLSHEISDHLKESHKQEIVCLDNSIERSVIGLSGDITKDSVLLNIKPIPIFMYNQIFIVKFVYTGDKTLTVYIVMPNITALTPSVFFCGLLEVIGEKGACLTFSKNFLENVQVVNSSENPFPIGVDFTLPEEMLSEFYNQESIIFRTTIMPTVKKPQAQKRKNSGIAVLSSAASSSSENFSNQSASHKKDNGSVRTSVGSLPGCSGINNTNSAPSQQQPPPETSVVGPSKTPKKSN